MINVILSASLFLRFSLALQGLEVRAFVAPPDAQITPGPILIRAASPDAAPDPEPFSIVWTGTEPGVGATVGADSNGEATIGAGVPGGGFSATAGLSGASACASAGIPNGPGLTWCGTAPIGGPATATYGINWGGLFSDADAIAQASPAGCESSDDTDNCSSYASAAAKAALAGETVFTATGTAVPTNLLASGAGNARPALTIATAVQQAQTAATTLETSATALAASASEAGADASAGSDGAGASVPGASATVGSDGASAGVPGASASTGSDGSSSAGTSDASSPAHVISVALLAFPAMSGFLLWLI